LGAVAAVVFAGLSPRRSGRFFAAVLAIQWTWDAAGYHATFFSRINPAAWLFGALFAIEGVLLVWHGVVRAPFDFAGRSWPRRGLGWFLMTYALLYPLVAYLEGHVFPRGPTFGLPCPTTIFTIGTLLAAEPSWPRVVALIPILWSVIGGSAAVLLGIRVDLALWFGGIALGSTS
jgi:hypothetical protein